MIPISAIPTIFGAGRAYKYARAFAPTNGQRNMRAMVRMLQEANARLAGINGELYLVLRDELPAPPERAALLQAMRELEELTVVEASEVAEVLRTEPTLSPEHYEMLRDYVGELFRLAYKIHEEGGNILLGDFLDDISTAK